MTSPARTLLFASALLAAFPLPALFAQAAPAQAVPAAPAPPAGNAQSMTAILTPAIQQLRQTLTILRADKWKTPGPITQETTANIASIQRDVESTLPGLLTTADSNPGSVQDMLPAYRNVDALYDVVLRVTEVSKLAAPKEQSTALQQAIVSLEDTRRTLGDQVQSAAANQTRAIVSLQAQLRTAETAAAQNVAAAAAPVCPPVPPPAKKKPAAKPKPKTPDAAATPAQTH